MKPLQGHTVIVAEDERSVRMLLRVVLEAAGATVLEAENGAQALRLLELHNGRVSLVVSDLNMPEMDGEQLALAIRLRFDQVPVVMCSAMDLSVRTPMLRHIVQGIVSKPFAPPELVRAAARAIADTPHDTSSQRAAV